MLNMTLRMTSMWLGRATTALLFPGALAIGLTGCINPGSGFAVLDRAAEASDELPTDLPDYAYDDLEPESARFVVEHDGAELYLAKGAGARSTTYLLVYPHGADWVISCGGGQWFKTGGYEVRADGMPAPYDAIALSPNIYTTADGPSHSAGMRLFIPRSD